MIVLPHKQKHSDIIHPITERDQNLSAVPLGEEQPVPARAALVHDLGSVISGELAESIVAVNNRPLHDLRISQQETGFLESGGKFKTKSVKKSTAHLYIWLAEKLEENLGEI